MSSRAYSDELDCQYPSQGWHHADPSWQCSTQLWEYQDSNSQAYMGSPQELDFQYPTQGWHHGDSQWQYPRQAWESQWAERGDEWHWHVWPQGSMLCAIGLLSWPRCTDGDGWWRPKQQQRWQQR